MMTKAKRIAVTAALLLILMSAAFILFAAESTAVGALSLISEGDAVTELEDAEYSASEKRMLSVTVDFSDGAEGGLVFGAKDGKYFVFKVNRYDNEAVLAYFDGESEEIVEREFFVGPSNMTADEQDYVASRTSEIERVYLRVVITPDAEKTAVEFYADGIKRFVYTDGAEEAKKLYVQEMEASGETLAYEGGKLGYYCGEYASVKFSDITSGKSDYSYYNEMYRNQYHFSQYAHWNNDPNGLVYYGGYYHVYFQHNPYGDVWGPMHWGHARSRDLVHWEMLPIALVPDYEQDETLGAIWSGSARVYHKGDSALIDGDADYMWFDESGKSDGDAVGLIGFYTRHDDGEYGGNRYTVVMYSDDGGLTWNKRDAVHRTTSLFFDGCKLGCDSDGEPWGADVRPSWRDPKVFDISALEGIDGGYRWGMALTGMEDQALYFLKSRDMVNWEHAGVYKTECNPECPDVLFLDGHTVITLTSRYYFVCDLKFEGGNIVMNDLSGNRINELLRNDLRLKKMEYGPDSYAAQTFYIDADSDSPYRDKTVGLSWFSGVPGADISVDSGALAAPRKVWNGGGMTVPVIFGLNGDRLTQTPVTADDAAFAAIKTNVINIEERQLAAGEDPLENFNGRSAEIKATVDNPSRAFVSFKVNERTVGDRHYYTEIGWNSADGYFVSRVHSEDGGINQGNYYKKFVSGVGREDTLLKFYILIDRNAVEVFCGGGAAPFYLITFASPYSTGASFTASGAVTASVSASTIASAYRTSDEIMINLSSTELDLGDVLTTSKEIVAYAEGKDITWSVTEGEDIVKVEKTADGAVVTGLAGGVAKIKATAGEMSRTIDVTVHSGELENSLDFTSDGIIFGDYYYDGNTLVCHQPSGDGFILSQETAGDFESYAARFDLGYGPAAAVVFRASTDENGIADGLIVNYDNNSRIVKMWSLRDEHLFAQAGVEEPDITDITIAVRAVGKNVQAAFNGKRVIDVTLRDDDPVQGRFGLNVCKTRAVFKSLTLLDTTLMYDGSAESGDMELRSNFEHDVTRVINRTLGNSSVPKEYWYFDGDTLTIDVKYISILPSSGEYVFGVDGGLCIDYVVNVTAVPLCELDSPTINEKADLSVFVGGRHIDYVFVNGVAVATRHFAVENYVLTIDGEALPVGDSSVRLVEMRSGEMVDVGEFEVTVMALKTDTVDVYVPPRVLDFVPMTVGLLTVLGVTVLALAALITVAVLLRRGKIKLPERRDGRTQVYRRRDFGLIAGAAIILPIAAFALVGLITSPRTVSGCVGWIILLIASVLFGYPFASQMFWNGKIYRKTVSPMKTRGTPKEIFAVDKSNKKFRVVLLYIAAAFKTAWLAILIAFCGLFALIESPFGFVSQMRGLLYGEFGFSAEANETAAISETIAKEEE